MPKSFMWRGWAIGQYPGYVTFFVDSGYQIIRPDDKTHLHDGIELWNVDSRGG